MRNEARRASKIYLLYGIPLTAIVVVIVWVFSDRPLMSLPAYFLIPIALAMLEIISPWLWGLFQNHWKLTPSKLILRGTNMGSVRWRNVTAWSVEELSDLPGYYRVRVTPKYGRLEIVLSETAYARRAVEEALATHLRKEMARVEIH